MYLREYMTERKKESDLKLKKILKILQRTRY
jgi:hypothetical protein